MYLITHFVSLVSVDQLTLSLHLFSLEVSSQIKHYWCWTGGQPAWRNFGYKTLKHSDQALKDLCRREFSSSFRIQCRKFSRLDIRINLMGIFPVSRQRVSTGDLLWAERTLLSSLSSTLSNSEISFFDNKIIIFL